jgi:hypothetical protein
MYTYRERVKNRWIERKLVDMVVHVCNPRILETEAGESGVQG